VRLDHVVLRPQLRAQVEELIAAARTRRTVLERWGIGRHLGHGKGVSALFFGDPGTGKTLCAEAIAGELGRPLLLASLPALLSRWVGQTEANLAQLFERARRQDAVLFLDEADSLLMERGRGRASRHDDAAVNVLLQLLERHEGLTLLATNLPDRLDRALSRRLTYRLHFPAPGARERADIWRRLLPETAPVEGRLDLALLGRAFELSGGQIKNAAFKAAFRAASAGRKLTQAELERAATEELAGAVERAAAAFDFAEAAQA
jgi:SpoVK/Ycf46/Vps4 family AAA+-type ATPase